MALPFFMTVNLILLITNTQMIAQKKKILIMALLCFLKQISKLNNGKFYAYEFKL